MRKMLAIASVALVRFVRDRGNLFFVFVLPLGIVILIGAQFGGNQGVRMGVVVPVETEIGAAFLAELEGEDDLEIVTYVDRAAMVQAVERGNIAVGVAVPDGLDALAIAGDAIPIELVGAEGGQAGQYQALVSAAMAEATARESAIRLVTGRGAGRAEAAAAVDAAMAQVAPITVVNDRSGESLFEGVGSQFEIPATSQLILFMFLTGLAGSAALIQSRNLGVTRRVLGTPTSSMTLIAGEGIGRLAVSLVQGLYIILATTLLFQVGWGNLIAAAAIILVFGACSAGGAMLFGSLFRSEQIAAMVGVISGLGLAALGGCMLPLELFSPALKTVAHFTPHAWALDAFSEIQRRGGDLFDILPQLGVLALFAVGLLALASWRMGATLGRGTVRE